VAVTVPSPRRRADAVRNYERVVAAAAEVLAEKGADAGVPEIAARAGVGKGTVYRCFPTKDHLIGAVVAERLRGFTERMRAAAERPDAWAAFVEVLEETAEAQAGDCTFSEGLAHDSQLPELCAAREQMYAAVDALMTRAQAEGALRAGAGSEELRVLFAGVGSVLRADGERDPAQWRRYARLVADALRAR
jgi:AcrR family transcriptional regulator